MWNLLYLCVGNVWLYCYDMLRQFQILEIYICFLFLIWQHETEISSSLSGLMLVFGSLSSVEKLFFSPWVAALCAGTVPGFKFWWSECQHSSIAIFSTVIRVFCISDKFLTNFPKIVCEHSLNSGTTFVAFNFASNQG